MNRTKGSPSAVTTIKGRSWALVGPLDATGFVWSAMSPSYLDADGFLATVTATSRSALIKKIKSIPK